MAFYWYFCEKTCGTLSFSSTYNLEIGKVSSTLWEVQVQFLKTHESENASFRSYNWMHNAMRLKKKPNEENIIDFNLHCIWFNSIYMVFLNKTIETTHLDLKINLIEMPFHIFKLRLLFIDHPTDHVMKAPSRFYK